jgi:hypothetical protein
MFPSCALASIDTAIPTLGSVKAAVWLILYKFSPKKVKPTIAEKEASDG